MIMNTRATAKWQSWRVSLLGTKPYQRWRSQERRFPPKPWVLAAGALHVVVEAQAENQNLLHHRLCHTPVAQQQRRQHATCPPPAALTDPSRPTVLPFYRFPLHLILRGRISRLQVWDSVERKGGLAKFCKILQDNKVFAKTSVLDASGPRVLSLGSPV